jgi:hypothetical protein
MKRLNPLTNELFKFGDIRNDGRLFYAYTNRLKKDGFFIEMWLSNKSFEKQKNIKKNKYSENKDDVLNKNKQYYLENKETILISKKTYKQKNRARYTALGRHRELCKSQRTPSWLSVEQKNQIFGLYKKANELGKTKNIKYHVDHIVPLCGKTVSGLHVPWNLQVIPATENMKKYNKLLEEVT